MAWRVLVVDDDLSVGMALYEADTSIEIVEAKDIADALELASSAQFDAIVCERSLPDGDGLAFVRLSRSVSTTAIIPIIVLTSHYDASARDEVLSAGADGYLPKPIRPDALIAGLAAAITRRRPRHLATTPTPTAPPVDPVAVDSNNGYQGDIALLRTERDAANKQLGEVIAQRDNLAAQLGGLLTALADARAELIESGAAAAERENTIAELQLLVADLQRDIEAQHAIDLRAGPQHAKKHVRGPST